MIKFFNGDALILAQDGDCEVYVCSVEAQRKSFLNKGVHVRTGDKTIILNNKKD
jgi:hypothetical protein